MKNLLFAVCMLVLPICMSAQKIAYAYDPSGNRIERVIVLSKMSKTEKSINFYTEEIEERTVKYYPDASGGQITVEISSIEGMQNGTITVHSFPNGSLVLNKKITSTKEQLDMSNQSNGIYILRVNIDGEISTWKIMKK